MKRWVAVITLAGIVESVNKITPHSTVGRLAADIPRDAKSKAMLYWRTPCDEVYQLPRWRR
jgi:hypothetical protein